MINQWIYALVSVILVSLVSLIGATLFLFKKETLDKILLFLVSLSAGSLFGGAFLHLLPEAVEEDGFTITISLSVLGGIMLFFILEKFVHWHHCHDLHCVEHSIENKNHLAIMNLVGDGIHNFIDGLIIGGSYLASIPLGIAATIAIVFHEVPQEISDWGVLLYSGLSKAKALLYNFFSALLALVGTVIALLIGSASDKFVGIILPFAAGGFLYIAGSDLIPELHKKSAFWKENVWQLFAILLGIGIALGLVLLE
ncbi:MAG TPA: ZIP family metal transporter [Candidatus Nanoarchaeia archaeon]|nr:ZIP family metal transporter [Candidatus Nanoarchaeia archaeon]